MSTTLWEQGHRPGPQVVTLASLGLLAAVGLDLEVTGRLSPLFDIAFVAATVVAALAVRPRDFFAIGVLPPLLMLGVCVLLSVVDRATIADARDGAVQAVVSGLTHHAGVLITGYTLSLATLALRRRVMATRRRSGLRRRVVEVR